MGAPQTMPVGKDSWNPVHPAIEPRALSGERVRVARLAQLPDVRSSTPGPGYNDTSEFFIGSVAVGVFLVESTGSAYDWSDAEIAQTLNGTYAGLNWWAFQEPKARLTFSYELHIREPTAWEPIQYSLDDDWLWIDEIMTNLGYAEPNPWAKTLHFNNDLRNRLGTDWAYSIFVADSNNAVNLGLFTNNQYAAAYFGGPWVTMSRYSAWAYNSADYFRVVPAHETGHIFYATDEYDADPVEYAGYLNCPDNNGAPGIMNRNTLSVSASTRCQIGWIDADGNGVLDIVDVPPETTLIPHSPDPTSETSVTYLGTATVVALLNRNPYGFGDDITVSRITGVAVRIDNRSWMPAEAVDGSFGDPVESFTFTLRLGLSSKVDPLPKYSGRPAFEVTATVLAPSGTHLVEARANNTEGNTDRTPGSDSLQIMGIALSAVELWYTKGGGPPLLHAADAQEPWSWMFDTLVTGGDGNYDFYSIIVDIEGSREPIPSPPDAATVVDTAPPALTLTKPVQLEWIGSTSVDLAWTATDSGTGIERVLVALDKGTAIDIGTSTNYTFHSVLEGLHTIYVTALDRAGNAAVVSRTFGVDVTDPVVTIISPGERLETVESTVVVTWNGSDSVSRIDYYEIRLDGGDILHVGTNTSYTFAGLSDGTHSVTVKAADAVGNDREATSTFIVHANWLTGGGRSGWLPMGLLVLGGSAVASVLILWRKKKRRRELLPSVAPPESPP